MASEMTEKHTFKNVECSSGVRERELERSESAFCPGEIGGDVQLEQRLRR